MIQVDDVMIEDIVFSMPFLSRNEKPENQFYEGWVGGPLGGGEAGADAQIERWVRADPTLKEGSARNKKMEVSVSQTERRRLGRHHKHSEQGFKKVVLNLNHEQMTLLNTKIEEKNKDAAEAAAAAAPEPSPAEPEPSPAAAEPEPEPTTIFAENIKVETSDWGWGATAQGHVMEIMDVTIEKKDGDWYLCMTKDGAPAMPDIKLNDIGQIESDTRRGTGKKKNVDFVIHHGTDLKRVIRPDERPDVRAAEQDRVNLRKFIWAFQQAGFASLVEECVIVSRIGPSSGGGKRRKTKRRKSTRRTIRKRKSTTKRRTKKRRTKKRRSRR